MRIVSILLISIIAVQSMIPAWRELQMNNYRVPYYRGAEALDILIEGLSVVAISMCVGTLSLSHRFGALLLCVVLCILIFGYRFFRFTKERTHVKMTKRMWRLATVSVLAVLGIETAVFVILPFSGLGQAVGLCIIPLFRPMVCILNFCIRPLENRNNRRYIASAKEKISSSGAICIGITGSYGKTGCKNILKTLLSEKYRVICPDGNKNTPLGIASIADKIAGYDILLAELGARRKGDIKELCDMINPTYGIITGVTEQHLESFHDIETIYTTKKELLDALPPMGYAVLNGDNVYTKRMAKSCAVDYECAGLTMQCGLFATEIVLDAQGSAFTLNGWGEPFRVRSALLGRHNVLNLLLAIGMARKLGLSKEEVLRGLEKVKPSPHRLELVENERGITIIDDSYNANIDGVRAAYEVLGAFQGRKVVFAQGIVELGQKQKSVNQILGKELADVADLVFLMGENARAIGKGLAEGGMDAEKILYFRTLAEVQEAFVNELRPHDVLLIQNDIP